MCNISVFYIVNLQKKEIKIQIFLQNSSKEPKRLIFSQKTNYSN